MKSEIVKLIWDVKSFHGLVLCAKISVANDPDAAVNCKFDSVALASHLPRGDAKSERASDFEWLINALEAKPFTSFCDLPPVLRDRARIQIWIQGKRGGSSEKFTDPKKALDRFEVLLEKYGGSWDNILVVWSDPENQPQMQQEQDLLRSKNNELRSGL